MSDNRRLSASITCEKGCDFPELVAFMPAFDSGFKIVAHNAGKSLAALGKVTAEEWQGVASEVQTTERFADRAFKARNGNERFLVYMEAFTFARHVNLWNVLAKSSLLSEREKLPTRTLIYILRPRGYVPTWNRFRLEVGGEMTQELRFKEICLWKQVPSRDWAESPALMALYPLSRHGETPGTAMNHAANTIIHGVADRGARADLLTTLAIFGKLVYPEMNVWSLIGREQMKESKFYQELVEEGRLQTQRETILDLLAIHFGADKAAAFKEQLEAITDSVRLRHLFHRAAQCSRLKEFRDALKEEE